MRREARELALQILFQTEFSPTLPIADILSLFEEKFSKDVVAYAELIITGVLGKKESLDSLIQNVSQRWKLNRMSTVDRNIIRIAVFEMKFSDQVIKPSIAINEAVEIAKKYGTTESGAFVNGILDQVSKEV